MTPERWQQIEKLCQSALEREGSQRSAFLEEACAGDQELRRAVESLLRFDRHGDGFIEKPALDMAARMMAHEKPESLIGQHLGSYQILSLLGAGGMGVVYQARDTRLKRSVAIKVLPADRVSDPERKRRFIQEARAASALNHPNIITIYDIGSESGIDFIVMEYVAGKTLGQLIPRKGMQLDEALKLAIQMADALAKAHSAGIVHRDVKPTNVMVTDDGLIRVLDFGLAKLSEVESDEEGARTTQPQTETGTIIGTVSYMSPEQAEGKKVDARSDIFGFGAVLYEMVTGQKAFEGDSKMSTVAAILKQEPRPISQLVPDIPGDLEKIINRCLRKDPGRRFQHMDDLKVELEELKKESDSGLAAPERLPFSVGEAFNAAISRNGNRLAYQRSELSDANIWRLSLSGSAKAAGPPARFIASTRVDRAPQYSPDGKRIAFESEPHGGLWVFGSAMRTDRTPWNCSHRPVRVLGPRAGRLTDNVLRSTLMRQESRIFMLFGRAEERQSA